MNRLLSSALLLSLVTTACGGDKAAPGAPPGEAAAPAAAPPATGKVIEVKMISEGAKNYFEPSEIEAKQGDRLKLVLVSGVHNMAWPPAKNPAGVDLPDTTEMLQLPGQEVEVPITMPPGKYNFVCVPHEAIGMVGTLEVEDD
ncbi:MAG TPA: plastocyanin/azurin family copper-binding protein [Gemmatimonadales bacterium]